MIKDNICEIWNNLHPIVHFWLVISAISVAVLYSVMALV